MTGLLLRGGLVFDLESENIVKRDILIEDGRIAEPNSEVQPDRILEIDGMYVAPGFMDAHIHVESSKIDPLEFARQASLWGTTGVFVDPHELANVFGARAVELFISIAAVAPLDMFVGVPSCVPATHLETSGAEITLDEIKALLKRQRVYGLAEMMNFPGIVHGFGDARERVRAAIESGKIVDGHCPGLAGSALDAYVSNGENDGVARISSDHEVLTVDEAVEKIEKGMTVMLREGSATRNLEDILPGLIERNANLDKVVICSDDLSVGDLIMRGHMNFALDKAISIFGKSLGISTESAALKAIKLATINTAKHFGKTSLGTLNTGARANIAILSSLDPIDVKFTIHAGNIVADNYESVTEKPEYDFSEFKQAVRVGRVINASDFEVSAPEETVKIRVIGAKPGSLITENLETFMNSTGGKLLADPAEDIAKIAVIERHRGTGNISVGFVKGLGLTRGALASTVAHDSHNIIVAAMDDLSMAEAVNTLINMGGGMVACDGKKSVSMPLELGGLMSTSGAEAASHSYEAVKDVAMSLGCDDSNVFMTLSFLALPVIPSLKITDKGIVDVAKFDFVDLFVR